MVDLRVPARDPEPFSERREELEGGFDRAANDDFAGADDPGAGRARGGTG
jgi:hypothetical protein